MKPGDTYTKDNIEVTVHYVDATQVYGVRYRLPVDEKAVQEALDNGERPPGCMGAFRMTIPEFERDIMGAKSDLASKRKPPPKKLKRRFRLKPGFPTNLKSGRKK